MLLRQSPLGPGPDLGRRLQAAGIHRGSHLLQRIPDPGHGTLAQGFLSGL